MTWAARRSAVLLLLAVFFVGGAAGWVLEEVVDEIHWPGSVDADGSKPDRPDDDEPFDDDAEEDFLESLGLSRAQLDSVDFLLGQREDRLEDYWKTRMPDLQALIDSSRQEIRGLLTPQQRDAYDRWLGAEPGPNQP